MPQGEDRMESLILKVISLVPKRLSEHCLVGAFWDDKSLCLDVPQYSPCI